MKRISLKIVIAALLLGVSMVSAQETVDPNPYVDGENLIFEGKYKRFGLSFTVVDLNFKIRNAQDSEEVFIESVAKSRGTLVKLFGFKFLQRIDSTVDKENLQIKKTKKLDVQKKRIRNSEAEFDYEDKKVSYVETDPNDPSRPPRRVASTIDVGTQDVVTAVYMLRRMPLSVGKRIILKISDSGLVYDVPVNVTARERKKSILGKKWCWKLEPEIFGEGRFIEQKGSLTIWITDDNKRIPIRAKLNTKLGGVDIKLKKINPQISQPNTRN